MSDLKICVMGSGGTGKSCITIQFIQGSFVERYDPTIEDSYRKHLEVDQRVRVLDILDTAGQQEYSAMRDSYMRTGDGFVFVFDLTDPSSLVDALEMHEQLQRSKDRDDVPVVLVGNKCDLISERAISREECLAAAKKLGNYCKYVEASAKENVNITTIFETVVKLVDGYEVDEQNGEETDEEENATNSQKKENKSSKKKNLRLPKMKLSKAQCSIL
ncbi:hypothetical protein FDP41_011318 [Naegleria fowleri]|uniref:Uncharacterized protein n=1 Tax=Naegleria fowleri TaxID=5763 RepID=A0A6A5C9M2_NAEFO|nr:uncharacterized protein FDP41_011318 [Naegleria fowleri]KAF0982388.1 hypothetical protein FDP41_011318 [Naegleria fowleri]CAG4714472.1 unnamed protein product [Naegleria fowleri]